MIDNAWRRHTSYNLKPNDWLSDAGLRACSLAARGLWIDMNCIMHQAVPYGHLVLSQTSKKPARSILPATLARMVGSTEKEVVALLAELEAAGIFSRVVRDIIYSRQMVSQIAWEKVRSTMRGSTLARRP